MTYQNQEITSAVLIVSTLLILTTWSCTKASTQEEPRFGMTCQDVDGASGILQRCSNSEVICYRDNMPGSLTCILAKGE
jgi:hypothetical protein